MSSSAYEWHRYNATRTNGVRRAFDFADAAGLAGVVGGLIVVRLVVVLLAVLLAVDRGARTSSAAPRPRWCWVVWAGAAW